MCIVRKPFDGTYFARQGRRIMRKSERLRQLELEFVRMQMQVELLTDIVTNLLEVNNSIDDSMDAGKWYVRKPQRND